MTNLSKLIVWDSVTPEGWSFHRIQHRISTLVFELPKVPDFSSSRFQYLGEESGRQQEVARRQMQMLRQLHAMGSGCAFSLRLVRESDIRLRFLVLVRFVDQAPVSPALLDERALRTKAAFPKEYSLIRILPDQCSDAITQAVTLTWASFVDEILKPETIHPANIWPFFYVPVLLEGQPLNDVESLCRTLLRFRGEVVIDVTLIPTTPLPEERGWVEGCTQHMREALTGERVYSRDGTKVLRKFDPMPGLRAPVENFEDLLKRYDKQRLFMYAIRVFTDRDPSSVTSALVAGATRSKVEILRLKRTDPRFTTVVNSAGAADIAPEVRRDWWDESDERPFRAQRLHRLVDLEEIASFWRLPIPMHEQFPGITLDRGLDVGAAYGVDIDIPLIVLGTLADETAQAALEAAFDREELTKHGLIVGTPGSGKTTLMFNLLHQLWKPTEHRVPFIVLEPAKTEYRALKTIPLFRDDLLVFTLGDERTSPFRFNPFHVPDGITLESHISRLNACFVAAFDLFDPLPMLLDQAIRDVYEENGWTELAVGGGPGCGRTPTLADLHLKGKEVADSADYAGDVKSNIRAALDLRLASLLRGSKGYMLNTQESVPADQFIRKPVVLELDALNQDEKALLMMFVLTFVYEYAKSTRLSGSLLSHVLVVEEAHNLIGRTAGPTSLYRANPREHAIELFIRMLAEMRALGQGIIIADQLPTALAPEAMKNTNLKVLMRLTAMDDRLEIGNTMGLAEEAPEIEGAVHLPCGRAYVFLEGWDRVRLVRTPSYKHQHGIEQPQTDGELQGQMVEFEHSSPKLYMPFEECGLGCKHCDRATRSAAKWFVRNLQRDRTRRRALLEAAAEPKCEHFRRLAYEEAHRRIATGQQTSAVLPFCLLLHLWYEGSDILPLCGNIRCECEDQLRTDVIEGAIADGHSIVSQQEG